MTREERLALMQELLEPMRKYLPPGEDAGPIFDREASKDRTTGGARLAGPPHSR
jgi:hypothetical protein